MAYLSRPAEPSREGPSSFKEKIAALAKRREVDGMQFWLELVESDLWHNDSSMAFDLYRNICAKIAKKIKDFLPPTQDKLINFIVAIYSEFPEIFKAMEIYPYREVFIALTEMLPLPETNAEESPRITLRETLNTAKDITAAQASIDSFYMDLFVDNASHTTRPFNFKHLPDRIYCKMIEILGFGCNLLDYKVETILNLLAYYQAEFPDDFPKELFNRTQQTMLAIKTEPDLQKTTSRFIGDVLNLPPPRFQQKTQYLLPAKNPLHQLAFAMRELIYPVTQYSKQSLGSLLTACDAYIAGNGHNAIKLAIVYEYGFHLRRIHNIEELNSLARSFAHDLQSCGQNPGEAEKILAAMQQYYVAHRPRPASPIQESVQEALIDEAVKTYYREHLKGNSDVKNDELLSLFKQPIEMRTKAQSKSIDPNPCTFVSHDIPSDTFVFIRKMKDQVVSELPLKTLYRAWLESFYQSENGEIVKIFDQEILAFLFLFTRSDAAILTLESILSPCHLVLQQVETGGNYFFCFQNFYMKSKSDPLKNLLPSISNHQAFVFHDNVKKTTILYRVQIDFLQCLLPIDRNKYKFINYSTKMGVYPIAPTQIFIGVDLIENLQGIVEFSNPTIRVITENEALKTYLTLHIGEVLKITLSTAHQELAELRKSHARRPQIYSYLQELGCDPVRFEKLFS